jgi:hypothetical protein
VSNAPEEPSGYKKYMPGGEKPMAPDARRRLLTVGAIVFVLLIFIVPSLFKSSSVKTLTYSTLLHDARQARGRHRQHQQRQWRHHRTVNQRHNYTTNGPVAVLIQRHQPAAHQQRQRHLRQPLEPAGEFLPYLIWILIFVAFMYYISADRRVAR